MRNMSVGEVVAALSLCCSENDDLLFVKSIYSIDVHENDIEVYFVDGNTQNVRIYSDGRREYLQ